LAFHEALRQELRYWYKAPNVRTSVVHPLWVRTPMIKVLTDNEAHFRQPIMTPQVVSDAICKQILTQSSGQVILPARQSIAKIVRAMPNWMQEGVRSLVSANMHYMRECQQRDQQQSK
jgi:short-subunit dehydrogenase